MQLTASGHAAVYDLQANQSIEVTIMSHMENYLSPYADPVVFSHAGFSYRSPSFTVQSNLSHTLGLVRPPNSHVYQLA